MTVKRSKILIGMVAVLAVATMMACAGKGKFYMLQLHAGDRLTGTLESDISIVTARGAKVELPANSIEEIEFGSRGNVQVTLRDGNEFEGAIQNKILKFKLSATGKLEEIEIGKIESFARE